jgi:hypothetical protein
MHSRLVVEGDRRRRADSRRLTDGRVEEYDDAVLVVLVEDLGGDQDALTGAAAFRLVGVPSWVIPPAPSRCALVRGSPAHRHLAQALHEEALDLAC